MRELAVDISTHRSKHLREFLGDLPVRVLIVVCAEAEKTCPTTWPGALNRFFWPFDDPATFEGTEAQKVQKFREIRDQIHHRIKNWLADPATIQLSRKSTIPPAKQSSSG